MKSLLSYYHPTKVIFIDDSSLLLETLPFSVDDKIATFEYFEVPQSALEFINNSPSYFQNQERHVEDIHKIMYNPKRYEEISTVIVDYEMPSMKGLDFCEKIKNPYIRKILYTGAADENIAINAFNKGLIHGYIKKTMNNEADVINNFIRDSQLKYFKSITDTSIESLLQENSSESSKETIFCDPVFAEYFYQLLKDQEICEHYLTEISGSFIFLSSSGKPSAFFTYPEETFERMQFEFQNILEENMGASKGISPALMKDLQDRKKMICLPSFGDQINPEPEEWEKYIYPTTIIEGQQTYYTSYIPDVDYVDSGRILSFDQYSYVE